MLHCTSRVLQNALSDRQVILAEGIAGPQAASLNCCMTERRRLQLLEFHGLIYEVGEDTDLSCRWLWGCNGIPQCLPWKGCLSFWPLHVTSLKPSHGWSSEDIFPVFLQNTVVLLKLIQFWKLLFVYIFPSNTHFLEGKWNLSGFDSFTLNLLVLFYKHQATSK